MLKIAGNPVLFGGGGLNSHTVEVTGSNPVPPIGLTATGTGIEDRKLHFAAIQTNPPGLVAARPEGPSADPQVHRLQVQNVPQLEVRDVPSAQALVPHA